MKVQLHFASVSPWDRALWKSVSMMDGPKSHLKRWLEPRTGRSAGEADNL